MHKGIDIFAPVGTPVVSAKRGLIIYRGEIDRGGNIVVILCPLLRIHYYAHLDAISPDLGIYVSQGDTIGVVGTTGNAQGGPAHLHYTIMTPIPYPWRWSSGIQGFKKMFYLDPGEKILNASYL